jgi:hypothetical protein
MNNSSDQEWREYMLEIGVPETDVDDLIAKWHKDLNIPPGELMPDPDSLFGQPILPLDAGVVKHPPRKDSIDKALDNTRNGEHYRALRSQLVEIGRPESEVDTAIRDMVRAHQWVQGAPPSELPDRIETVLQKALETTEVYQRGRVQLAQEQAEQARKEAQAAHEKAENAPPAWLLIVALIIAVLSATATLISMPFPRSLGPAMGGFILGGIIVGIVQWIRLKVLPEIRPLPEIEKVWVFKCARCGYIPHRQQAGPCPQCRGEIVITEMFVPKKK